MKRKKITFLTLMLLLVIVLSACDQKHKEVKREVVPVRTINIEKQKISIPINTSGRILSSSESKLSFKTGGIINSINVNEGETVKEGKLMASLDLSEIEAKLKNAKNGYLKAKRDFERAKNLYEDKVATLEQFQNAETGLEIAESNLKIAEFNYHHSKISAPSDGVVLKKLSERNELVGPGTPIFIFGTAANKWRIIAGVTDADIVKIKIGDSAKVELDAFPDQHLKAVVSEVGQAANPMNGTYEVELTVYAPKLKLVSGLIVRLQIYPSEELNVYLIPPSALVEADGQKGFIYEPDKGGNGVKRHSVKVIKLLDEKIAVSSNSDLREIIFEGALYLNDESQINIQN